MADEKKDFVVKDRRIFSEERQADEAQDKEKSAESSSEDETRASSSAEETRATEAREEPPAGPDSDYIVDEHNVLLDMDYKDMLLLGMEKEEASFRTYVNLVANARDEQTQELLLALAEEEVKHKLRFQTEYDILAK